MLEQIRRLEMHNNGSCRFSDMELVHEVKKGLCSTLEFVCSSCGELGRLELCPKNGSIGINEAAALAIRAIGLGKAHIDEFFAHLNVPSMSSTLFSSTNKVQQNDWWYLAKKSASEALEKEVELAVESGLVDAGGFARITITVDGSWGKRSFGSNMSSLSGCAVLVGMRTRKIIYFDVRNKYCHVCKLAQVYKRDVREHVCNKNYSGPATGMEADIIVSGFKDCELKGARFDKFVADGDSNAYKIIQDLRIYKDPDMFVDKFYCKNHLYKNFNKKWRSLQADVKYPKVARDLLTLHQCSEICKGVEMATQHWKKSSFELAEQIHGLVNDIMNAPFHYFDSHSKCATYFCQKQVEPIEKESELQTLNGCGLFEEVQNACMHYFANNAKSLLAGYTTNDNESFNSLICKRLGGKRINNYLGGTYKASVAESVVHFNSGYQSGSTYHTFKGGESSDIKKLEQSRKRKSASNLAKKQQRPKKRKVSEPATQRNKSYGPTCEKPDLEPDAYDRAKYRFIEKLKNRQRQRDQIEKDTRGQRLVPLWNEVRQDILVSTYFGRIVNNRNKSSFKNLLGLLLNFNSVHKIGWSPEHTYTKSSRSL